jgi:tetratricopeptide (TPR) repeat protein
MSTPICICLPDIHQELPQVLKAMTSIAVQPVEGFVGSPTGLRELIAALAPTVDCVVGSEKTPGLYWLAAQAAFPQARVIVHCSLAGSDAGWFDLHSGERLPLVLPPTTPEVVEPLEALESAESVEPVKPVAEAEKPVAEEPLVTTVTPASTPKIPEEQPALALENPANRLQDMSDAQLIHEAFLKSSWGNQPDFVRDAMAEAASREAVNPGMLDKVRKNVRLGEHAAQMWNKVLELYNANRQGPEGFESKYQKLLKGQNNPLVRRHLQRKLERHREFAEKKRKQAAITHSRLRPVQLQNGIHPNSLRHLPAHSQWEVLIDETGKQFGPEVDGLKLSDKNLGRVVALALPTGRHKLPILNNGLHGTEASPEDIDRALQQIVTQPVGVFGFTLKDAAQGLDRHWLSAVETMMRWVLRQLPLPAGAAAEGKTSSGKGPVVKFLIERRDDYEPGTSLSLVCRILRAELAELDSRYAELTLSAEFISKSQHPCNGYVDAIAYSWGSPADVSKDRLRKSLLKGHCLLQPDDFAMQRLYMALDRHLKLEAGHWYALVANLQGEPKHSLATELAGRLGEKVQTDADEWYIYLEHVQMLMQQKRFRLMELAAALDWLQTWKPADAKLPALVQLHWHSSRLACANHFGATSMSDAQASIELGESLLLEDSPSVCESDLRVAVAATNAFEFETAAQALHHWIAEDPAVPGLKNWCKVQSSLGQHAAFMGENDDALNYFDAALDGFRQLQDARAAGREIQQTYAYRLIVQMDKLSESATGGAGDCVPAEGREALVPSLEAYLQQPLLKFARSGHLRDDNYRYPHHVFLRALVAFPEALAEFARAYVADRNNWYSGNGHPWPLIATYRAILLVRLGEKNAAAAIGEQAVSALDAEEAPLLQWMQVVLVLLLKSAGLTVNREEWKERLAELKLTLPSAPFAALEEWQVAVSARKDALGAGDGAQTAVGGAEINVLPPDQVAGFLRECLPFNFH